jgi:hypothetical protein
LVCLTGPAFAATIHLEAEDYRASGGPGGAGIEGTDYHDTTEGNSGAQYRTDNVDIENTTDADNGNGVNVGWMAAGEWWILTTDSGTWQQQPVFEEEALYTVEARIARNPTGDSAMHIEVDGVDVTGSMTVPSTAGWQTWESIFAVTNQEITAGEHEVKFVADGADFNVNWIEFTPVPEPGTITLALVGFLGLSVFGGRRRQS